jgi:ubiquinone/menaquinone biosynthesis C-methylase UbiE
MQQSDKQHKHFITRLLESGAKFYDPILRLTVDEHKLREKFIELANIQGDENILDIACGTGNLDRMVAEMLDSGTICGIDISPKMVEISRERAEKEGYNIDYKVASSTELPYGDREFDLVFTSLMYHHLYYDEKRKTLSEIHRVLKRYGQYISVEFGDFPDDGLHKIFSAKASSGTLYGLYPLELIEEAGFRIVGEIAGPRLAGHHDTKYRVMIPVTERKASVE